MLGFSLAITHNSSIGRVHVKHQTRASADSLSWIIAMSSVAESAEDSGIVCPT